MGEQENVISAEDDELAKNISVSNNEQISEEIGI